MKFNFIILLSTINLFYIFYQHPKNSPPRTYPTQISSWHRPNQRTRWSQINNLSSLQKISTPWFLGSCTALFLLTHHVSAPRLNYLLRTSRTYVHPEILTSVDNLIIDYQRAKQAANVILSFPSSRQQAILSVRHGGLGLLSKVDHQKVFFDIHRWY